MEWTNISKLQHRIASDTKAWVAFSLAPGKAHTIRFPKPGRYPYRVDGKHTGLIIVQAAAAAQSPNWTGTIESDSQRVYVFSDGGGAQCNDHWHGDFSFTVNPGGAVTGAGTMMLTSGPSCSGRIDTGALDPFREIDFSVSGSKQASGFTLTLGDVASKPPPPAASYAGITSLVFRPPLTPTGPPLTIPNTGPCAAGGTVATSYILISDTLSASNVVALKCKTP